MKLHENRRTMELLLTRIRRKYGVRADILEKDYYVTLLLEEL